jgi:hypothetical protein
MTAAHQPQRFTPHAAAGCSAMFDGLLRSYGDHVGRGKPT